MATDASGVGSSIWQRALNYFWADKPAEPVEPVIPWDMVDVVDQDVPFYDQTEKSVAGIQKDILNSKIHFFITLNKNKVLFNPPWNLSKEEGVSEIVVTQESSDIFWLKITMIDQLVHCWAVNISRPILTPEIAYTPKQMS